MGTTSCSFSVRPCRKRETGEGPPPDLPPRVDTTGEGRGGEGSVSHRNKRRRRRRRKEVEGGGGGGGVEGRVGSCLVVSILCT